MQQIYSTELVQTHALRELTLSVSEQEDFNHSQAEIPHVVRLIGGEALAARI